MFQSNSNVLTSVWVLRALDIKQKRVFNLCKDYRQITSQQVAPLLNINHRAARSLCRKWIEDGFLVITDPSKKSRKYSLAPEYEELITQ